MATDGFRHVNGALARCEQEELLAEVEALLRIAPLFEPWMPRTGKRLSVRMTNLGPLGWVTDKERGYRYQATHPVTGKPWPPIPAMLHELWAKYAGGFAQPEACLVNFYGAGARMGSHRDTDEEELRAPVLSISLGDDAVFHIGGATRNDAKTRVLLRSGDVVVLGGAARLHYHGIDRVVAGSSDLVPGGGRFNLTLRRVTPA